jgi:YidC/Oxa1 family membrane protein insertase
MDRRTIAAILLVIGVIVITPMLFPTSRPLTTPGPQDASKGATVGSAIPAAAPQETRSTPSPSIVEDSVAAPPNPTLAAQVVRVQDSLTTVALSTQGAAVQSVELKSYEALDKSGRNVALTSGAPPLLSYRLVVGGDTARFSEHLFAVESQPESGVRAAFRGVCWNTSRWVRAHRHAANSALL